MDPTLDEMQALLKANTCSSDFSEADIAEAIYWFANDWHGGQDSALYSALCTCGFEPGPISRGPQDTYLYDLLQAEYFPNDKQDDDPGAEAPL